MGGRSVLRASRRRGERLRGRAPSSGDGRACGRPRSATLRRCHRRVGRVEPGQRRRSDRGRVGAWADEQARAPPGPRSALSGSEMTVGEEEERVAAEEGGKSPSAAQPGSRLLLAWDRSRESSGRSERGGGGVAIGPPGEEKAPGPGRGRGRGRRSRRRRQPTRRAALTGNASRFESARASAEIDDWLEDEIWRRSDTNVGRRLYTALLRAFYLPAYRGGCEDGMRFPSTAFAL